MIIYLFEKYNSKLFSIYLLLKITSINAL